MIRPSNRSRAATLAVVLLASAPALANAAGPAHPKAAAPHPAKSNNNAAHAMAAAAHQQAAMQRNMVHQQQAMIRQQQAATQQHHAAQNQKAANANGTNANAVAHNGVPGAPTGTAHHHVNNNGTGVHRGYGTGTNHHQNQNSGQLVSSLRTVVSHLHQADHDYDGHRVRAIHQIDQAIRVLHPGSAGNSTAYGHLARNGGTSGAGNSNGQGPRMPQAMSDAHLRQAHQALSGLESQMANGGANNMAHHQQAHGHIQQALRELNVALATR